MNSKCDPALGRLINERLIRLGVETPMVPSSLSDDQKIDQLTSLFSQVWNVLGMDLEDDSLAETPLRMAKMFVKEIYWGLDYARFPKCTTVQNKMQYNEMVTVNDIRVMSNCEHHGVVIDGVARVAYIPRTKVLGLSKINRVVDFFSRRPQIQERLTEQIYGALSFILETPDVAVKVDATHYCVKSRGASDANSWTTTTKLGGVFVKPSVRSEFLQGRS